VAATSQRPVVSNTTPLINLVGVKLLDLLPGLYTEVWIPEAVRDEYAVGKAANDPELAPLPWLKIVAGVKIDAKLPVQLGAGEAATLSLALSANARAVLLDETYGRRVAQQRRLPIVGTLGVLLAAKQTALLPAVRPVIDEMIRQGRHISVRLRAQILRAAGE
jgi:predicted nucleic acid-binding protein